MARIQMLGHRLASSTPKTSAGWSNPHRGSRHERGYGTAWDKLRAEVLRRDAGLCQPCLRAGHVTPDCRTVDHKVNKAQGGDDRPSNLQTICTLCHARKTQAESRGAEWDGARG